MSTRPDKIVRKLLRLPAPHFHMRSTTLHCFVYFKVNNGVWSFLDYVEDTCWSLSSAFLKSLIFNLDPLLLYCITYTLLFLLSQPVLIIPIIDATNDNTLRLLPSKYNDNGLDPYYDHIAVVLIPSPKYIVHVHLDFIYLFLVFLHRD